ncbi:glycosyltransferase, partial [Nonomuraea ferruginea]
MEAFGLVALEAQTCGLPVLYRPVPGLVEVLNDSALAADLADLAALRRLSTDHAMSADLRTAGLANAARFPLSATAAALTAVLQVDGDAVFGVAILGPEGRPPRPLP